MATYLITNLILNLAFIAYVGIRLTHEGTSK